MRGLTDQELYDTMRVIEHLTWTGDLFEIRNIVSDIAFGLLARDAIVDPNLPLGYSDLPEADRRRLDEADRLAVERRAVDIAARRREQAADRAELRAVSA